MILRGATLSKHKQESGTIFMQPVRVISRLWVAMVILVCLIIRHEKCGLESRHRHRAPFMPARGLDYRKNLVVIVVEIDDHDRASLLAQVEYIMG